MTFSAIRSLFLLALPLAAVGTAQVQWAELSPTRSPSQRWDYGMAAGNGVVVMFGGTTPTGPFLTAAVDETEIWDGITWTMLNPTTKPPPLTLIGNQFAYDDGSGDFLLFGGSKNDFTLSGETWNLDTSFNWTKLAPAHSPPPREGAAMVYCEELGVTVMYGGRDASGQATDETWVWDGTDWTQKPKDLQFIIPGRLADHAMAYDASRGLIVMFGGTDGTSPRNFAWSWDGAGWHEVAAFTRPPARSGHSIVD